MRFEDVLPLMRVGQHVRREHWQLSFAHYIFIGERDYQTVILCKSDFGIGLMALYSMDLLAEDWTVLPI